MCIEIPQNSFLSCKMLPQRLQSGVLVYTYQISARVGNEGTLIVYFSQTVCQKILFWLEWGDGTPKICDFQLIGAYWRTQNIIWVFLKNFSIQGRTEKISKFSEKFEKIFKFSGKFEKNIRNCLEKLQKFQKI